MIKRISEKFRQIVERCDDQTNNRHKIIRSKISIFFLYHHNNVIVNIQSIFAKNLSKITRKFENTMNIKIQKMKKL